MSPRRPREALAFHVLVHGWLNMTTDNKAVKRKLLMLPQLAGKGSSSFVPGRIPPARKAVMSRATATQTVSPNKWCVVPC